MPRPNDPMTLDLTDAQLVARASTEHDGRPRWTVLSVYRLGDLFIAQSEGMSSIPGERTKTRRIASVKLERALKLFEESDLGLAVAETAREWEETRNDPPRKPWKVYNDATALEELYGGPERSWAGKLAADFGVGESSVRMSLKNGTPVKVPLAMVMPFLDLDKLAETREARIGR